MFGQCFFNNLPSFVSSNYSETSIIWTLSIIRTLQRPHFINECHYNLQDGRSLVQCFQLKEATRGSHISTLIILAKIRAKGSWWHFPNTNSYLAAIFLWHHSSVLWLAQNKWQAFSGRPDLSLSKPNLKSVVLLLTRDSHAALKVNSTTKKLCSTM